MENKREEFLKTLEEKGEATVRAELTRGIYGSTKWHWVKVWLNLKDQERLEREEASRRDSNQTARSAKNAAWAAATAAIIAAISAIIVLISD